MLGIRLSRDAEAQLERYAREVGRPKSVLARDWLLERLERESIDEQIRRAAAFDAAEHAAASGEADEGSTAAWMRWLDAEDGGYDWGPEGPPV